MKKEIKNLRNGDGDMKRREETEMDDNDMKRKKEKAKRN